MSSKARDFARLARRLDVAIDLADDRVYLKDVNFDSSSSNDTIQNMVTDNLTLVNLQDVEPGSTINQVLTANGDGTFFFADNTQTILELDIEDGTAGQFLIANGDGTFEFANNTLLNLNINDGTSNQILKTNGQGNFYFGDNVQNLTELNINDGLENQFLASKNNQTFEFQNITFNILADVDLNTIGVNKFLTTDGAGGYKFEDAKLVNLADIVPTAEKEQVLTANGDGTFYFANNAARPVNFLTDLNITDGTEGQVLKTDGAGNFFFDNEETLNSIIFSIALG